MMAWGVNRQNGNPEKNTEHCAQKDADTDKRGLQESRTYSCECSSREAAHLKAEGRATTRAAQEPARGVHARGS